MISDSESRPHYRRHQSNLIDKLGDVAGKPRHLLCAFGIAAVAGKQMAVVLDRGAAARRGDEYRVERLLAGQRGPGVDIAARMLAGFLVPAEMLHQSTAADLVLDHDDIDAMTPQ